MSSVSGTSSDNPYADLGIAVKQQSAAGNKQSLGQTDFLKLMTTQLQYQDPFKPMDNGEFLGQMAQFSTVSGIQDLQASFSSLASSLQTSQALQGASLVGHAVLVPATSGYLGDDTALSGAVDVKSSGTVSVQITWRASYSLDGQHYQRVDDTPITGPADTVQIHVRQARGILVATGD